mmetsp:Transcript_669/g.949  ORF Transcript_669/g.949 Transcript_669/m.949 type:complete len:87 (-) Transcript_669:123-383(-)
MSKQLWLGAGAIFIGAMTMKQYIFYKVSQEVQEIRKTENQAACNTLENVYARSRQYSLPPLTKEEKEKIKRLKLFDSEDYNVDDDK